MESKWFHKWWVFHIYGKIHWRISWKHSIFHMYVSILYHTFPIFCMCSIFVSLSKDKFVISQRCFPYVPIISPIFRICIICFCLVRNLNIRSKYHRPTILETLFGICLGLRYSYPIISTWYSHDIPTIFWWYDPRGIAIATYHPVN